MKYHMIFFLFKILLVLLQVRCTSDTDDKGKKNDCSQSGLIQYNERTKEHWYIEKMPMQVKQFKERCENFENACASKEGLKKFISISSAFINGINQCLLLFYYKLRDKNRDKTYYHVSSPEPQKSEMCLTLMPVFSAFSKGLRFDRENSKYIIPECFNHNDETWYAHNPTAFLAEFHSLLSQYKAILLENSEYFIKLPTQYLNDFMVVLDWLLQFLHIFLNFCNKRNKQQQHIPSEFSNTLDAMIPLKKYADSKPENVVTKDQSTTVLLDSIMAIYLPKHVYNPKRLQDDSEMKRKYEHLHRMMKNSDAQSLIDNFSTDASLRQTEEYHVPDPCPNINGTNSSIQGSNVEPKENSHIERLCAQKDQKYDTRLTYIDADGHALILYASEAFILKCTLTSSGGYFATEKQSSPIPTLPQITPTYDKLADDVVDVYDMRHFYDVQVFVWNLFLHLFIDLNALKLSKKKLCSLSCEQINNVHVDLKLAHQRLKTMNAYYKLFTECSSTKSILNESMSLKLILREVNKIALDIIEMIKKAQCFENTVSIISQNSALISTMCAFSLNATKNEYRIPKLQVWFFYRSIHDFYSSFSALFESVYEKKQEATVLKSYRDCE